MSTVSTNIEQDHCSLCTSFLTLEKYAFVFMAFRTLVIRPRECRILRKVLGHACCFADFGDQLVLIDEGVGSLLGIHAVSACVQQPLVYSILLRIEHIIAVQAEPKTRGHDDKERRPPLAAWFYWWSREGSVALYPYLKWFRNAIKIYIYSILAVGIKY